MSRREQALLLAGIVIILSTLALFEWLEPEETQTADPQRRSDAPMNPATSLQAEFVLNVPQSTRSVKLKNRRNIFAPLEAPNHPHGAQPPTPAEPAPPIMILPPEPLPPPQPFHPPAPLQPTGPTPAELAARQARAEMKQYTFLGYLTKEGVRQAFLSKDEDLYVVKEGERFEQDIEIQSIGPTEVVLSKYIKHAKTTVEATLSLTPNEQDGL